MPGLADLFTDGVVAVLELVEHKGIEPGRVDLSVRVKDGFIGQDADNFTNDVKYVNFVFVNRIFALRPGNTALNRKILLEQGGNRVCMATRC